MLQNDLAWQATAAANLLEARKRHARLGSKKSRRGCLTCKTRRIKCDETRPECNRCRSTGRKCDGYTQPTVKSTNQNSLVGRQLSNSLGLVEGDRRRLDFLLSRAAPGLSGSLDRDFWCGTILQIAQSEPIVLDSLLAISTLYEHPQYLTSFRETSSEIQPTSAFVRTSESLSAMYLDHAPPMDPHHLNAVKLYNKAIQGFHQRMEDGTATVLLGLVSCVLFIAIETIRDRVFAALPLFERGANMLNQLSVQIMNPSEMNVFAVVRQMFSRFGVLATAFGHPTPALEPQTSSLYVAGRCFQNIAEARHELFSLLEESNGFSLACDKWREDLYQTKERWQMPEFLDNDQSRIEHLRSSSKCSPDHTKRALPVRVNVAILDQLSRTSEVELQNDFGEILDDGKLDNKDPAMYDDGDGSQDLDKLRQEQDKHLRSLEVWRHAFEPLSESSDGTDAESASYLFMLYYTFLIRISAQLSTHKSAFDEYTAEFHELVHHAEIYLKLNTGERPVFTFDIGAVPSLYYTATECRIPSVRRRALALLKRAPKKESIMGAEGSTEVAACLISFEERGLGLPDPADFVERSDALEMDDTLLPADDRRWHSMQIFKNRLTKAYEIRVTTHSEINGRLVRSFEDVPI